MLINKKNWEETQTKWHNYWKRQNTGRPLMCIVAEKEDKIDPEREMYLKPADMNDMYLNAARITDRFRYFAETHEFLAESFPNLSADFGPGSMAAYLGCDIIFSPQTVWFESVVTDKKGCKEGWADYPALKYDPANKWLSTHLALVRKIRELAGDDYYIGIPDILENIDVLASMRGAQDMIYDMMDSPEEVEERIRQVQALYFEYFDRFYDIVKDKQGGSCYTVFQVYGSGKTAKLQCDFSAMMSPEQFRHFIIPALGSQAKQCDHVLYHLDGPDAIRHVPALMSIDEIDALQWTSGDYGPDGTMDEWYHIYDQAAAAGKALWIKVYSGTPDEWIKRLDKLVARYGSSALFLYFSPMSMETAEKLIGHAEKYWCDIEGSFIKELRKMKKNFKCIIPQTLA